MTGSMISSDPRRNYAGPKPGMNTLFIVDYGREIAFSNLIRMSRVTWIKDYASDFDGTLDASGYVIDAGTATIKTRFVIIAASTSGMLETGTYALNWDGSGTPSIVATGGISITETSASANRKTYSITDWGDDDVMYLDVPLADTGAVTNVRFCYIDYEGTEGIGEENEFYPPLLQAYEPYKHCVRFMNWQATNQQNNRTSWDERRRETYRTYTHGPFSTGANPSSAIEVQPGVPLEVCVRFQNKLQGNGWYCIPAEYDGSSVSAFCEYLADNVDPGLKVLIELGNENWNAGFDVNDVYQNLGLAEQAATGRFTAQNASYPFWAYSAWRSASCMDIASSVFADRGREDDLVRVLGLQVGNPESKKAMDTDCAEVYGVDPPIPAYTKHDAASTTSYWGGLQEPSWSDYGLSGNAASSLRDGLSANVCNLWASGTYFDNVRNGTMPYESDVSESTSWAWWANEIKNVRGLEMYAYEGSQHVTTAGTVQGEPNAQEIVAQYDTEVFGNLIRDFHLLSENLGFQLICHYVLVEKTDPDGYWGHVESYTQLNDPDILETKLKYRGLVEATGQHNKRNI